MPTTRSSRVLPPPQRARPFATLPLTAFSLTALCLAGLLAGCGGRQIPQRPEPTAIGNFAEIGGSPGGRIGGRPRALAIDGGQAFLAAGARLVVRDMADPAQPREVGRSSLLPAPPEGVATQGDLVYLAAGDEGLRVLAPTGD
jgi:hypothetical protein